MLRLMGTIGCAATVQPGLAAPATRGPSAGAAIAALGDAMPQSFDIYPADPCGGVWDIKLPDGSTMLTVLVMRYRGVPLAHITGPQVAGLNRAVTRLDPHSVAIASGTMQLTLRCAGGRAVAQMMAPGRAKPLVLDAVPAEAAAAAPSADRGLSARVDVHERGGDIEYLDASGVVHQLTRNGNNSAPVLAPDGHSIAFIHLDGKPTEEGEPGFTSLWLADLATGTIRRLLASRPDAEPERDLAAFGNPRFSLDGGFVYVDADAWTTSTAVHQVNVASGAERFVIAGKLITVIRTGPYRGYLLVDRHKHHPAPEFGSYDAVYVVRPDGVETLMVPGSDADDGQRSVPAWLSRNGWQAW